MKEVFAKIIELESCQVLVYTEYEGEDDLYKLVEMTMFDGLQPSIKMGFKSEESCQKVFTEYGKEQAEAFVKEMKSLVE